MIKAAIVGCSGYTAIEAIKLLLRHPQAQITAATSRQADGNTIDAMHPQLTNRLNLIVEDLSPEQIAESQRCGLLLFAPRSVGTDRFQAAGCWLPSH